MKALYDRVAGFQDRDRPAAGVRLDREHGARELPQRLVVVGIAFRTDLDPGRPSGLIQSLAMSGGSVLRGDVLRLQRAARNRVERDLERRDQHLAGPRANGLIGLGELGQGGGEPLGGSGAGARSACPAARSGIRPPVQAP